MYELIQISDSSYYIQSPAKIGLVKLNDKEVCLIDSGNDKDAGRHVVYLADCLSSRETLDKYQIGFIYDIAAYIKTLEMVKSLTAKMFVPAHAAATEDISELAQYNIDKVQEIAEKIVDLCKEPLCFEAILQRLFTEYALTMNFEQYILVGSTVRSYLSWLKDTGRLNAIFENNMLLWVR